MIQRIDTCDNGRGKGILEKAHLKLSLSRSAGGGQKLQVSGCYMMQPVQAMILPLSPC